MTRARPDRLPSLASPSPKEPILPRDPEAAVRALPFWRGAVALQRLHGGLSNVSFRASDASGDYVARVGDDFPFHHVSRAREAAASRWAGEAGLGPKIVHGQDGVLVAAFLRGKTFAAEDVRARLDEIAALLKRAHAEMRARARGDAAFFWVFHVIRGYADTLRADGHAILPQLPRHVAIAAELEAAQVALPIVFGHHDLLPANFIGDADRIWLIDWEYAGFGTPMFDLANLADNAKFGPDEERRLLRLYFGAEPAPELARSFAAMKAASALREALWAYVSLSRLAAPGFDYAAYGNTRLEDFESAYAAYQREFRPA